MVMYNKKQEPLSLTEKSTFNVFLPLTFIMVIALFFLEGFKGRTLVVARGKTVVCTHRESWTCQKSWVSEIYKNVLYPYSNKIYKECIGSAYTEHGKYYINHNEF